LIGRFEAIKTAIKDKWNSLWTGLKDAARNGWETFTGWLSSAIQIVKDAWDRWTGKLGTAFSNIFKGLKGVAKSGLRAAASGIVAGINAAIGVINAAIRGINRVNPFKDIPQIPTVSVPNFALGGGLVGGGLALVGEEGPEVVRLSAGDRVFPMDRVGGKTITVTVVLDGRVIASAVGPHLTEDLVLHTGQRR
jgi:phage-related tail protein